LPGSLDKKGGKDSIFWLIKEGIFFLLSCLMNLAQVDENGGCCSGYANYLCDGSVGWLLVVEDGWMLEQVDEKVGRAVEDGEEVGEVGDVPDPVRPDQLTLGAEETVSCSPHVL
jgi:hypothetical protein